MDEPSAEAEPGESGQEPTAQHRDGRATVSGVIQTAVRVGQLCGARRFRELLQFEVQKGVGLCRVVCPQWTGPRPRRPRQGAWGGGLWTEGSTASSSRDRGHAVRASERHP